MAGNSINMDLKLQDSTGSIKARTNETKALNSELEKSQKLAAAKMGPVMAGTAPGESKTARSIGGGAGTGSAASDFAAQAKGLGGLVHVYATFAANLFAVSAAFTGLSKAMDTANLVAGLDQIGAASGKNLGSLAKQMVSVADGALSMQQAMTSTAMASAGGMSSKDILRMTEVAKKASLALGRDLPDSMDRLTKGIVKTQPELLDELGIMTRMIPAQQAYAQKIGKTVDSLTDLEKRQAFSNAVLAEGEAKFSAIALQANPYTKILSSTQNLLQSGLELVNKVLTPLVDLLSKSPVALGAALTSIASILLKQAMPAIGAFRENAKKMADEATILANKRSADAKAAAIGQVAQARHTAEAMADAELEASQQAMDKLNKLRASSKIGKDTKSYAIMQKDPSDITTKDLEHLTTQAKKLAKSNKEASDSYIELRDSLKSSKELESQAQAAIDKHTEALKTNASYFSIVAQQQRIADKANQEASIRRIASIWAENTQTQGFLKSSIQGWKELWKARKDVTTTTQDASGMPITSTLKGISAFQFITGGIKETAKSAASAVMTLASSLNNVFMVAGLATTVGLLLNDWLSKTKKESEEFSKTSDQLAASLSNVDRTLDVISKKDPLQRLSISTVQALANAFDDLKNNTFDNISAFEKLTTALKNPEAWLDRFKENISTLWGGDTESVLAENLSNAIKKAISIATQQGTGTELQKKFAESLGVTGNITAESIKKAAVSQGGFAKIIDNTKKIIEQQNTSLSTSSSNLIAYRDALNNATKESLNFTNTFMLQDPLAKYALALFKVSDASKLLTSNESDAQKAILETLSSTDKMAVFGEKIAVGLLEIKKSYETDSAEVKKFEDSVNNSRETLLELQKAAEHPSKFSIVVDWLVGDPAGVLRKSIEKTARDTAEENYINANKGLIAAQDRFNQANINARDLITKGMQTSFKEGAALLEQALGNATEKASITMAKGALGALGSGTEAISANIKISDAEAAIQIKSLNVAENQLLISTKLNNTLERANLLQEQAQEKAKPVDKQDVDKLKRIDTALTSTYMIQQALEGGVKDIKLLYNESRAKGTDPLSAKAQAGRSLSAPIGSLSGIEARKKEIEAQNAAVKIAAEYSAEVAKANQTTIYTLNNEKAKLNLQVEQVSVLQELGGFTTKESVDRKNILETSILQKTNTAEEKTIQAEIDGLTKTIADKRTGLLKTELEKKKVRAESALADIQEINAVKLANKELQNKVNIVKQAADTRKRAQELEAAKDTTKVARDANALSITEAQLAVDYARGKITEDEKNRLTDLISNTRAQNEYDAKSKEIRDKIAEANNKVTDSLSTLDDCTVEYYRTEVSLNAERNQTVGILNEEQKRLDNELTTKLKLINVNKITAEDRANWSKGAQKGLMDYQNSAMDVAGNTAAAFTSAFKNMEDSLLEFVKTGEFNFTKLADSIISDLMRIAIQKSITGPLAAIFGSFFATGGAFGASGAIPMQPGGGYAKGGAFEQGYPVVPFAKGGTFTNSVVSSPTLFKFAQGTGLMGEAGPEAIMPLKRDNNGNLGVRAGGMGQGGNNVVINIIESKDKAGTQERKTENGVDMINVFVEKVKSSIAGDIARGSGQVPAALTKTYGLNRAAGAY